MSRLSMRGSIRGLETATRRCMGRMDQPLDAYEGDGKPCPQTFGMGVAVLVNRILKPYYRQFVSPRFPGIWALGWKVNVYFEDVDLQNGWKMFILSNSKGHGWAFYSWRFLSSDPMWKGGVLRGDWDTKCSVASLFTLPNCHHIIAFKECQWGELVKQSRQN
jgi:hypothetical protein